MQSVDEFIFKFLKPPSGKSPAVIRERILHWIEVANHAECQVPPDTAPENKKRVAANLRRKARQNAKRNAERHPEIADQLMRQGAREAL